MANTATADTPAPAQGKKKLIIMVAVAVLVLAVGGVAAMMLLKKKPAQAEGEDGDAEVAAVQRDPKVVPVFVPLDPFTVNLADRDAERYAQVGITLEISDPKVGDQIKSFMPAIRNNILMAIADRSAADLIDRNGKLQLAEKVRKEASRALGLEIDDEEAAADEDEAPKSKKKKKKKVAQVLPIKAVHFSNFIIQ
ncbi:MAG: flagellar basal body rod protein [Leptothrix sp. (in: Bacteria)]|nr:flagellar basal body rod protein [Leptothrix sp. (in: b-proteobacteria)]